MNARGSVTAVIFDLDGTLTVPNLDFDAIRAEIGSVQGPILEALEGLGPTERRRAEVVLERHEARAARESELQPFAREVLDELRARGVSTAILTRNSRASVDLVCSTHGLLVDARRTREDGAVKPDPAPVWDLCRELGVSAQRAVVVGDYLFDLESARAAGAQAVLLRGPANSAFEAAADLVIDDLRGVLRLVTAPPAAEGESP